MNLVLLQPVMLDDVKLPDVKDNRGNFLARLGHLLTFGRYMPSKGKVIQVEAYDS